MARVMPAATGTAPGAGPGGKRALRILDRGSRQLVLLLATAIALVPVYVMITGAFKTQAEFLASPWSLPASWSFRNFGVAVSNGFGRWLLNSLIVTSISVAATMALAASAAWGYSRWRFAGKQAVLSLCIALMVIPPVVLLVPLFQLGAYLHQISTFQVVIVIYTGLMLPFSIYLLASFFSQIPESLVEAAIVDGASSWTVFRRVVLPLSGPPLITLGVVNLLWAWNELLIALVFLQSDTKKTLMVGISEFQSKFNLNIPVTMAGLSIAVLPLVAAYIFGQRYFIRGLTAGALRE
jgi:ABC-type glycerol-3-phosphate transport system permease component